MTKPKAKTRTKPLPKTVYIKRMNPGTEDEYLNVIEAPADWSLDLYENGDQIGVYELESVKTLEKVSTLK